jgi:hypothetical protein
MYAPSVAKLRSPQPVSNIRDPHSAFVGRDDFVGIKTEAAHRSDTASAATVASPMRFGPGISPKNEALRYMAPVNRGLESRL